MTLTHASATIVPVLLNRVCSNQLSCSKTITVIVSEFTWFYHRGRQQINDLFI